MARYIGDPNSLVDAIIYVFWLDCTDNDEDPMAWAELFGKYAGIDDVTVGGADDGEAALHSVLEVLVAAKAPIITSFLMGSFAEVSYIPEIVREANTREDMDAREKMRDALDLIYNEMDQFPEGRAVQTSMQMHIYSKLR